MITEKEGKNQILSAFSSAFLFYAMLTERILFLNISM